MAIDIESFTTAHVDEAAQRVAASVAVLRASVPSLSDRFTDAGFVADRLASMHGTVALEHGRLVGFLTTWYPIAAFRRTERVGAYVPEWGHGAWGSDVGLVYASLYREMASAWTAAGCDVHAITVLEHDIRAGDAWFRAGFGMGTIDGVRPAQPIGAVVGSGASVYRATETDLTVLAALDAEHVAHYTLPPTSMAAPEALDGSGWQAFLQGARNTAWLATVSGEPVGFLRLGHEFHGAAVTEDEMGVFVTGAYVRPAHRRHGLAATLLDAALRHHAGEGLRCCAVDFESFNPEAAAFWPRHFTPVCRSLMRVPER